MQMMDFGKIVVIQLSNDMTSMAMKLNGDIIARQLHLMTHYAHDITAGSWILQTITPTNGLHTINQNITTAFAATRTQLVQKCLQYREKSTTTTTKKKLYTIMLGQKCPELPQLVPRCSGIAQSS